MAIGEAGSLDVASSAENHLITVNLTEPLTNPVIALSGTVNGSDPYILRVFHQTIDGNGDTTAFTFIVEEWEYLDGSHTTTETINWLAVEEGVHTLPDGRIVEAGTTLVSSTGHNTGTSETFSAGFTDPPIVLTSVMSYTESETVDSDPSNITSAGFDLTLQEEEARSGVHAAETIGWIAIQAGGNGLSGTASRTTGVGDEVETISLLNGFNDGIVLAETQTLHEGDTASVGIVSQTSHSVNLFIQEEESSDTETTHANEDVGVVAFESGLIPCFTAGTRILTPSGSVNVEHLKVGDRVDTVDNGAQRIRWIGRRDFNASELADNPKLMPVRILAQALGQQLPERDLLVSRQHRMFVSSKIAERMFGVREVLVSAIKLTALPGVYIDHSVQAVAYLHILFDNHNLVFAEGAQAESLYLGHEAQNALSSEALTEISTIFPDLPCDATCQAARYIPPGRLQKKLMQRHSANNKVALMD